MSVVVSKCAGSFWPGAATGSNTIWSAGSVDGPWSSGGSEVVVAPTWPGASSFRTETGEVVSSAGGSAGGMESTSGPESVVIEACSASGSGGSSTVATWTGWPSGGTESSAGPGLLVLTGWTGGCRSAVGFFAVVTFAVGSVVGLESTPGPEPEVTATWAGVFLSAAASVAVVARVAGSLQPVNTTAPNTNRAMAVLATDWRLSLLMGPLLRGD